MDPEKVYAENLAGEYAPIETSKVVALKKLDRKAKLPSTIFAYSFGIVSALILGVGMCLSMKVIGSGDVAFIIGIIVGIVGLIMCGINYPIYTKIREKGKAKYAYEIVTLAKQISEDSSDK